MSSLGGYVILGLFAWSALQLLLFFWEYLRYRGLARAQTLGDFRKALKRIPRPARAIAEEFATDLEDRKPLEPVLIEAIKSASATRFEPPAWRVFVRELLLVGLASVPFVLPLLSGVADTFEALRKIEELPTPRALLEASETLRQPLEHIATGYLEGGLALAALAVAWSTQSWLRSPAVREARFLLALLSASTRLESQASAAVAGRMAEAIAPERNVERPLVASLTWAAMLTAGWGAIFLSSDLRRARDAPQVLSVWPAQREHPVEVPPGLRLPQAPGGRPVTDAPTLAIGPLEVRFGRIVLAEIPPGGVLGSGWREFAKNRVSGVGGLKTSDRVLVVAHQEVPAGLVLGVLAFIAERTSIRRFDLLFERRSGHRQARLTAHLGDAPSDALRVLLDRSGHIRLAGDRADSSSMSRVKTAIRETVSRSGAGPNLAVMPADNLQWSAVLALLGAADSACNEDVDCGLPGLGSTVWFAGEMSETDFRGNRDG